MNWRVLRTDKFNDQLTHILHYIADDSGSVDAALKVLDRIEQAVKLLETSPYMGSAPRYGTLRKQGYRVLIVEKHLIFYKADEEQKQIILYILVHTKQAYERLI